MRRRASHHTGSLGASTNLSLKFLHRAPDLQIGIVELVILYRVFEVVVVDCQQPIGNDLGNFRAINKSPLPVIGIDIGEGLGIWKYALDMSSHPSPDKQGAWVGPVLND